MSPLASLLPNSRDPWGVVLKRLLGALSFAGWCPLFCWANSGGHQDTSNTTMDTLSVDHDHPTVDENTADIEQSLSEGTSNCSDNQSESDLEGESLMWNDNIEELLQDVAANDEPLPEPRGKTSIKQAVTSLVSWFVYFLLFWQATCKLSDNGLEWLLRFMFQFLHTVGVSSNNEYLIEMTVIFPSSLYHRTEICVTSGILS
ncbi:hypothetical protein QZH41_009998 [Actinostola sp. cb2023]|nr:hypothetical protein QZH41_009998 [Actinostola sp. cb2023]